MLLSEALTLTASRRAQLLNADSFLSAQDIMTKGTRDIAALDCLDLSTVTQGSILVSLNNLSIDCIQADKAQEDYKEGHKAFCNGDFITGRRLMFSAYRMAKPIDAAGCPKRFAE